MSKAKKVLLVLAASFVAGAALGLMYAPEKGSEARKKLGRLKRKIRCCRCGDDESEDLDKETLEGVRDALQEQLDKVNHRLDL